MNIIINSGQSSIFCFLFKKKSKFIDFVFSKVLYLCTVLQNYAQAQHLQLCQKVLHLCKIVKCLHRYITFE